jgi:hypothetical protein
MGSELNDRQPIHFYRVDIIWQTKRGKKMFTNKWKGLECVSRAKDLKALNKDKKALEFLEKQTKLTAKKLNFRVYKISDKQIVGYSEVHKEIDYENEFK